MYCERLPLPGLSMQPTRSPAGVYTNTLPPRYVQASGGHMQHHRRRAILTGGGRSCSQRDRAHGVPGRERGVTGARGGGGEAGQRQGRIHRAGHLPSSSKAKSSSCCCRCPPPTRHPPACCQRGTLHHHPVLPLPPPVVARSRLWGGRQQEGDGRLRAVRAWAGAQGAGGDSTGVLCAVGWSNGTRMDGVVLRGS